MVVGHFADVDHEGAEHNDGGGCEDTLDKGAGEDASGLGARRAGHDGGIDRFDA